MMLVCKPKGRGNWLPMVMSVEGWRADSILVRVGATFELAGVIWRICSVSP
jgi:hypothetical protein